MNLELNLENAGWPVFTMDDAGLIRRANAVAVALFGVKLQQGHVPLAELWGANNDLTASQFLARLEKRSASVNSLKLMVPDKGNTPFLTSVCRNKQEELLFQLFPQPTAASTPAPADSGSSAKATESAAAQKQKLDCAMQLSRTVALDFNNALTTVLGHASYLLGQMEPDHPWRKSLVEIEKAADRAAEIAQSLETFSNEEKDTRHQTAGNLNSLLRRTIELFQNPQNSGITWTLQLEKRLFGATFDEAKLQQALVKILENAVEALEGGGRVNIQTRNLELTEPTQDRTATLGAGSYVCIEISDTGTGIAPDVMPRIFEPFFSTKYGHRGLGLAWVYGIVTNHGGSVAVSSTEKQGSAVRLYLPALQKVVEEKVIKDTELTGQQTIVMVDDEQMVLNLGQMVLSSFGYRVLTAPSGEAALEIFQKSESPIDLLITDMVMPRMNGRELIEKVRVLSPTTRIVCSTAVVRVSQKKDDLDYLEKPFTTQQLLRKVKEALSPVEVT